MTTTSLAPPCAAQGRCLPTILFTGQQQDATGLYYYGARFYDPTIGHFISPDIPLCL